MSFAPLQDNVLIRLLPRPEKTASGIHTPHMKPANVTEHREAVVIASGPGYFTRLGKLVPNTVQPGQRVIVEAKAGDVYHGALSVPRFNKASEFEEVDGMRGELRIIREQEILCVMDEEAAAE
jgi:co-chaperonin GroES (HSP10)